MRLARPTSLASGIRPLRLLAPLPRSATPELLDGPALDPRELGVNLRDIRRVNRFFGGTSTILRHLPELIAEIPSDRTITVLDLATGSADIPIALAVWARANGRSIVITASDAAREILDHAQYQIRGVHGIRLAQHDARAVSEPDASYDIVLCSLALHHFSPDDAILVLREMRRLSRVGLIVNDLCRSRLGYVVAWLAAHVTTGNRLTRHDAPLSVLRAYTRDELKDMLTSAGMTSATTRSHAWFRMAAVARTGTPDA